MQILRVCTPVSRGQELSQISLLALKNVMVPVFRLRVDLDPSLRVPTIAPITETQKSFPLTRGVFSIDRTSIAYSSPDERSFQVRY
jgi:hypothetical protein